MCFSYSLVSSFYLTLKITIYDFIYSVQNLIQSLYTTFKSVSSIRVSVIIPQAAIEEFIDSFG
jgi:hypothetical protein